MISIASFLTANILSKSWQINRYQCVESKSNLSTYMQIVNSKIEIDIFTDLNLIFSSP